MCKHPSTKIVPSGNKVHHSKMICATCNKFIKWMSKPTADTKHIVVQHKDPRGGLFGRRHYR